MRLTQIQQILEIERCGSVSAAASNLYVSQPALSAVLNDFEKEIEVKLFTRSKNGVLPTAEGEMILSAMKDIMRNVDFIQKFSVEKDDEDVTGTIKITMGSSVEFLYGDFLQAVKQRFPKVNIDLSSMVNDTILNKISRSDIDFSISSPGIVAEPFSQGVDFREEIIQLYPNVSFLPLRDVAIVAVFHKDFFPECKESFCLEDYANEQYILGSQFPYRRFSRYISVDKYPLQNLDRSTMLGLLQRIPAIYLDATPLSIEQYKKIYNLNDANLCVLPVVSNMETLRKELHWTIYLFYRSNIHLQLHKGILEEITTLLQKYDLIR